MNGWTFPTGFSQSLSQQIGHSSRHEDLPVSYQARQSHLQVYETMTPILSSLLFQQILKFFLLKIIICHVNMLWVYYYFKINISKLVFYKVFF